MQRAVVIPSYKAAATLPGVLDKLPERFWAEGGKAIIVNDASPDRTGEVADELASLRQNVVAVHHAKNRGYGGALKTGLRKGIDLGCDVMAVVHSDGQYAPWMVVDLCEPIENGMTEIVQGSRMKGGGARAGGMPMSRYLPNKLLTFFENLVVGTHLAEFHSGYMIFSRKLLERVPFEQLQNNYNFDAEMIILAHLCGIETAEIPIPTRYDDETSSLSPIPYGLNVLKMMARYTAGHYRRLLDEHEAAMAAAGKPVTP